ncbi:hypothetical protein HPP92_001052 [Vanilla planifolia]|uniref:Protein kinase domain-containing protein n=1 Tax=Vanilla planifolia TaxID=51239 RepID=A0A835VH76_VANPL|nr:hypothetical protein HPP92_001052 [Vanilla planifolia]
MDTRRWVRGGCVGKGSFGMVSLALDRANGGIFAVKSVCLNSAPPHAIAALENEIRLLSSLDSPHVIAYLGEDVTEEPSRGGRCRNLHLEYLPHGTLADAAAARKLGEHEIRDYARSIALALQYLHFTAGVVHGDIKGRNVLLRSAPGMARLSDFGSARRLSDVSAEGSAAVGELGSRSNASAQMYQIGFGKDVPKFPVGLSWAARDFLDKCLKRDPTERWSCEQLLQHSFLSNSLNEAGPSPRSVLSFAESELECEHEGDDYEDDDGGKCGYEDSLGAESSRARERIRQLAPMVRSNWTDEGWVSVRG